MDKTYARYMRYGKLVKSNLTGEIYYLIENMSEKKESVLAVNRDNYGRYKLLVAWLEYWQWDMNFRERFQKEKNIEDCAVEKEKYMEELNVVDVEPYNQIRFITSSYATLFEVLDLSFISINDKNAQVYYYDECHFGIIGGSVELQGIFHICEFAEIWEKLNLNVKPNVVKTVI